MIFASWRNLANRLRPVPLRFTCTAKTPKNIGGYKYAGSCLVLSYRIDDPGAPSMVGHEEDLDFLHTYFGNTPIAVFKNSITNPYFQCFGSGPFARVVNYHLVAHSKQEQKMYQDKLKSTEDSIEAGENDPDAYRSGTADREDRSARLRITKQNVLESFASRVDDYLKRPLCISPYAVVGALSYGIYKHTAVHNEFRKYASEAPRTKAELSNHSRMLYKSYVKGEGYTFLPYDCRNVGYQDGSVFLPTRLSVPHQCRLGLSFDITQYEYPARLLQDHNLKPSRYVLSLDPNGEPGFYVQLVYWFSGERMRLYHRIYSEDTPGVNFFHYIKGVSVGI